MWSSGEEHVRVMAFVGLTKLLRLISTLLVDFAIKVLYMADCLTLRQLLFNMNCSDQLKIGNPTGFPFAAIIPKFCQELQVHISHNIASDCLHAKFLGGNI